MEPKQPDRVTELKALAYDQLALIEQAQNNLRVINAEIMAEIEKVKNGTDQKQANQ